MHRSTTKLRKTLMTSVDHKVAVTKKDFDTTMLEVTDDMPRYRRLFSKFAHMDPFSAITDAVGSTIARPTPFLFGGISMFALTLLAYLLSKNLGYSLSGSEPLFAFLIGWIIGIATDTLNHFFGKH